MEDNFPRGGVVRKSRNKNEEKTPEEEKDLFQVFGLLIIELIKFCFSY